MAKIIIAIHGLGNKPPGELLAFWWRKSIDEGLRNLGFPRLYFPLELVYWANHLYPEALNPNEADQNNPHFIREIYQPGANFEKKAPPSWWRNTLREYVEKQVDKLFLNENKSINFSSVSDYILRRYFRDLSIYYEIDPQAQDGFFLDAKERIRNTLATTLEAHKDKEIMLIAHSMGSIIAYDVLTHLTPHIEIDTFVTMGSPLGLPVVVGKIIEEQRNRLQFLKVKTPENVVRNWYNLSDLDDTVAINYHLGDDYEPNSRNIRAEDIVVNNNYEMNGESNPHKSFGYLRTPEFSKIVHDFLRHGQRKPMAWLSDKVNQTFGPMVEDSANSPLAAVGSLAGKLRENIGKRFGKKS